MRKAFFKLIFLLTIIFVSIHTYSCKRQPSFTEHQMEWKIFNRNVDTDELHRSLEVIEDGYKMIRLIKNEEYYSVEWGWKFTVKNKSNAVILVSVTYILKDIDEFVVTKSKISEYVESGETKTIRKTSIISFDNVIRVVSSRWKVSVLL